MVSTSDSSILIVEDNPSVRELYRLELEDEGYEVRTAPDREAALAALGRREPELAIIDIDLNGDSGLNLLREILHDRSLRTILLTSYTTYRNDFTSWLADAFLVKSSDTTELKDTVRRLIGGSEAPEPYADPA